jgi:hypothetical protein
MQFLEGVIVPEFAGSCEPTFCPLPNPGSIRQSTGKSDLLAAASGFDAVAEPLTIRDADLVDSSVRGLVYDGGCKLVRGKCVAEDVARVELTGS